MFLSVSLALSCPDVIKDYYLSLILVCVFLVSPCCVHRDNCGFGYWFGLNIAPGPLTDESRQLVPGEKEHLQRHSSSGHLADMHRVEENKLVFEFHLREILRDFQIQHNANNWLNGQKNESQTELLTLAGNILSQQIKSVSTECLRPLEKMLLFLFLILF